MKEKLSTADLKERIGKNSKVLTPKRNKGNVRGIGVEDMRDESKNAQVARSKARILKKMSPTLDRGLQILSGMIACPEGGVRTNLNYSFGDIEGLSEERRNQVLATLKDYFDNQLDLENTLHDMVYKVISETGADVEVYIPMTLVDEVLGLESTGYVGNVSAVKDTMKYNEHQMFITNSMSALTQTPLNLSSNIRGNENESGMSRLSRVNKTTLALRRAEKPGVDGVVVRTTTGEAIIPIKYNGRVIRYVALLDEMGSFVTSSDSTAFVDLMSSVDDTSEKGQYDILGHDAGLARRNEAEDKIKTIREGIEDDVIKAILGSDKDGSGLDSVIESLGEENVIDILTARAMAAKKTRVIMLDPEYVSYFSLIENDNGRGITIIEDNSSIILLHVTLLYAKILSELESSIPKTVAEVTLDENDENSEATLKDIMGELSMSAIPDYNIDYSGNRELFRSLSKMNTHVKVLNADVPGMPNMDVSIERTQKDVRGPSSDVLESVGRFATQTLGISSENVDNSYNERFKLQVTRDNDITSRQLMRYVSAVDNCITDRGRKRVCHNDELWNELINIIGSQNAEDKLMEIMATLSIKLPELTSSKFENLSLNMEKIRTSIEDYIEMAIPDTVIDNGSRIDSDSLDTMREMVTGAVMRAYAANADLFGGLGMDLTSMAGIAEVVNGELEEYGDEFKHMASAIRKFNKKITKAADRVEAEEDEEETPAPIEDDTDVEDTANNTDAVGDVDDAADGEVDDEVSDTPDETSGSDDGLDELGDFDRF